MPRKKPKYQNTDADQRNRGETAAKKAVEYGIRSGKRVFCMFELPDTHLQEQYQVVCTAPPEEFPQFFRDVILPQCLRLFTVTETRAELDQLLETFRARANLGVDDYNLVRAGPAVGAGETKQERADSNTIHSIVTMLDAYAAKKRPDLRSSTQKILREVNDAPPPPQDANTTTTTQQHQEERLLSNRRFYIQCDSNIHEAYWPNAWIESSGSRDPSAVEPLLYNGFSKTSVGEKRARSTGGRPRKRQCTL